MVLQDIRQRGKGSGRKKRKEQQQEGVKRPRLVVCLACLARNALELGHVCLVARRANHFEVSQRRCLLAALVVLDEELERGVGIAVRPLYLRRERERKQAHAMRIMRLTVRFCTFWNLT